MSIYDSIYDRLDMAVDGVFGDVCREHHKMGDISPDREMDYWRAINSLTDILEDMIKE